MRWIIALICLFALISLGCNQNQDEPKKTEEPTPVEQPKPPVEQPKPPVEQPKPPVEQPKPPVEQPKPPVEQPKPPTDTTVQVPVITTPKEPLVIKPQIPEAPMPGGYTKKKVDDPDMVKMAQQAMTLLKKENPDWTLVKLMEVATQVVAGTNYFFRMEIKTSKGNITQLSKCRSSPHQRNLL